MKRGWLAIALLLGGPAVAAPASPALLEQGRRLVEQAECGRCHALPAAIAPTPRPRSCTGCHAWIHATGEDPAAAAHQRRTYPLWDRYLARVASFLDVPDLAASGARLDAGFVARYLRAPFKVRPTMSEGMIRTGFSQGEAQAVAAWLAEATRRPWSEEANAAAAIALSAAADQVGEGRRLFERLACGTCHARGERPATGGGPPAPDLGLLRDRMRPQTAAAFLADPAAFGGETRMPRYPISAAEAARLRDYLWSLPPTALTAPAPAELPLLERPVAYAEVRAQVLDRICIHCHMDPRKNSGEGGPGNTGGLGYRGVKLDLETWAGIRRGAVDAEGRRVSILSGEVAPLVARLRARYLEHARERGGPRAVVAGGEPGMPLGLPPLTPEQFQLVRSWVAQGAPGPVRGAAGGGRVALKVARGPAEGPKQ
jgi:mono/diheme cytochrome c family protein